MGIQILHLSDIHCGKDFFFKDEVIRARGFNYESAYELYAKLLLDDLRELEALPRFIVISGDAGYRGDQDIESFILLLDAIIDGISSFGWRMERERVILVPGNHDVNLKDCEDASTGPPYKDRPHENPAKYDRFAELYNSFYSGRTFDTAGELDVFAYPDESTAFIGLSSCAKISHVSKHANGYINIGGVEDLEAEVPHRCGLRIGVFHHPPILAPATAGITAPAEVDRQENTCLVNFPHVQPTLTAHGVRLFLHGHRHAAALSEADGYLLLGSGSFGYAEPGEQPGYNLIEIESEDGHVIVKSTARRFDKDQTRNGSKIAGSWLEHVPMDACDITVTDADLSNLNSKTPQRPTFVPEQDELRLPENYVARTALSEKYFSILSRTDEGSATNPCSVLVLKGSGGNGKSALAVDLMKRAEDSSGMIRALFGYSFYIEFGEHTPSGAPRDFFLKALDYYRRVHDAEDYERGASVQELSQYLLARLRSIPSLLLMDGLEPLQSLDPNTLGSIPDHPELRNFLSEACSLQNSRVVVTTRLPVRHLSGHSGCREEKVEELERGEAIQLLGRWGMRGTLDAVVKRFGRHALTLAVVAACGTRLHNSSAATLLHSVPDLEESDDGDERKLLSALSYYFDSVATKPERAFLSLLTWSRTPWTVSEAASFFLIEEANRDVWIKEASRLSGCGFTKSKLSSVGTDDRIQINPIVRPYFARNLSLDRKGTAEVLDRLIDGMLGSIDLKGQSAQFDVPSTEILERGLNAAHYYMDHPDHLYDRAWEAFSTMRIPENLYSRGVFQGVLNVVARLKDAFAEGPWSPDASVRDDILFWSGKLNRKIGRTPPSLRDYEQLIDLPDTPPERRAYVTLHQSYVLFDQGKYADAASYVDLAEKRGEQWSGRLLGHRGRCYVELSGFYRFGCTMQTQGIRELTEAIQVTPAGDVRHLCTTLRQRAEAYIRLGNFAKAEQDLEAAWRIAAAKGNPLIDRQAQLLKTRGDLILAKRGSFADALCCYREARSLAVDQRYVYLEVTSILALAHLLIEEDSSNQPKAMQLCQDALSISEAADYMDLLTTAHLLLARIVSSESRKKADEHLQKARALIKETSSHWNRRLYRRLLLKNRLRRAL